MSQQPDTDFDIDPYATSGVQLTTYLNNLNNALLSMRSGTTRPPSAVAGTTWLNTTVSTDHICYYYDGTVDIKMFTVKTATNSIIFEDSYLTAKGTSFGISLDGSALANDDSTDNGNIAIGANAGYTITSGYSNILFGIGAGELLDTGYANILIGPYAGNALTFKYNNSYMGQFAGLYATSNDCVGIGSQALSGVFPTPMSGDNNTSVGITSGVSISTGHSNSFFGKNAGSNVTTGFENTFIGINAGVYKDSGTTPLDTLSNTICLGRSSYATLSGEMSLGNSTYITTAFTAATFTQRSDERFKNITDIDLGLDFINSIVPIKYTWNTGQDQKSINYGFSAQQVKATLEEKTDNKKRTMHRIRGDEQTLAYTEFVAPLVKAVQELSEENQQLKKAYKNLLNRVIALENKEG